MMVIGLVNSIIDNIGEPVIKSEMEMLLPRLFKTLHNNYKFSFLLVISTAEAEQMFSGTAHKMSRELN